MPSFIDLFAGAGGLSLGLHAAGFTCLGVVEKNVHASRTYHTNFSAELSSAPLVCLGPDHGDMTRLDGSEIAVQLAEGGIAQGELDLLAASPPCQGFSHIGRSKLDSLAKQRGAFQHDERNEFYLAVADLLPVLKPRAFLVENVPGILNHARINVAERIAELAEASGYRVAVCVLNAAWYGVPQTRERVFVLGYRNDVGIRPTFPLPKFHAELSSSHLAGAYRVRSLFADPSRLIVLQNGGPGVERAVSTREALGDLPTLTRHLETDYRAQKVASEVLQYRKDTVSTSYQSIMRDWPGIARSTVVRNHVARSTPRDHETFRRMKPGDRYPDAVQIARARYVEALIAYRQNRNCKDASKQPIRESYVPPYPTSDFTDKWRKLIPSLPSWTVTAHLSKDGYSHIHYDSEQARSITPREAARLQSFPDSFWFPDSLGHSFRQIGNAVPPLMARHLGEHIARCLEHGTPAGTFESQLPHQEALVQV